MKYVTVSDPTPFTFGIPQTFTVSLSVDENFGGSVIADLWGFQFFDTFGRPLTNSHFTLVSVPEPSAVSLLSVGLMFFLVVAASRRF